MKRAKYRIVKGHKIPIKVWQEFVNRIKAKQRSTGSVISPKLFTILLDRLLHKRTVKRRAVTTKKTKKEEGPIALFSGNSYSTPSQKSDGAIKAAVDLERRIKEMTEYKQPLIKAPEASVSIQPKLIERVGDKYVVEEEDGKSVTLTKQEYQNMVKYHLSMKQKLEEKAKEAEEKLTNANKEKQVIERKALQDELERILEKKKIVSANYPKLLKKAEDDANKQNSQARILSKAEELNKVAKKVIIPIRKKNKDNKDTPRSNKEIEKDIKKVDPSYITVNDLIEGEKYKQQQHMKSIDDRIKEIHNKLNIEEKEREVKEQEGDGKKSEVDKNGLDNFALDKMMKRYPEYLGTISHDEIPSRIIPHVKPHSIGCCIINTDPASKSGKHWQALYWDAKKDMEINFYDSFGQAPDRTIMKGVRMIADKLDANTYLKFKQNRVKAQDNRSSTCGYHCASFLIDRLNGKHFSKASTWDDHIINASRKGEKEIEQFRKQTGFGAWSFIKSFTKKAVDVGTEAIDRVKTAISGRTQAPPIVRNLLSKQGDKVITAINVGRTPVNSVITSILNAVSQGKLEENQKKLGFDQIFHLFLVITLEGGYRFLIERNESVHVSNGDLNRGTQISVPLNKKITLNKFIDTGSSGNSSFWQYSVSQNNCQAFCLDLLSKNGLLTSEASKFITQDAIKLLENTGAVKGIADKITDFAGRLHVLVHGRNKYRK